MRARIWVIATVSLAVVAATATLHNRRTAGDAEVRAVTERGAAAAGRGDSEALVKESVLQGRPDTVARLIQYGSVLADGYQVTVKRNGADGYQLLSPADISHLAVIETASGNVRLGFLYDPEDGRLEF